MVILLPRKKKSQFEIAEQNPPQVQAREYGQHCSECDGSSIVNEGGCLVCKGWSTDSINS